MNISEEDVAYINSATFEELSPHQKLDYFAMLTRRDYPALTQAYEQLMMANCIHKPPRLIVENNELTQRGPFLALLDHDAIMVGPEFAKEGPTPQNLAFLMHEVGHLIAKHKASILPPNKPTFKNFIATRLQEEEADKLATSLLGSRECMAEARDSAFTTILPKTLVSNKMPVDTFPQRIRRYVVNKGEILSYKTMYGSPKEARKNILDVNLDDRTHLEALVEARNKATCSSSIT